jgi:hypothetical protein
MSSPNPDAELHLFVAWGDGAQDEVGCAPCRLDHTYAVDGTFTLTATVSDTAQSARTRRLQVRVGRGGGAAGAVVFSPLTFTPDPPNPIANFTVVFSVSDAARQSVNWAMTWNDPSGALIGCGATPGPAQPPAPFVGTAPPAGATVTAYCQPAGVPGTVTFTVSGTDAAGGRGSRTGSVTIP